ncbi:hypothetical protein L202_07473 [Cryptococcus amylolentus CBS 6039]|uniref:Mutanase n=1 Tax=Cryptococcus amylolentus CBS 6039 TaxID=1295533 RepID=A0A1E3HCB1_9TREE|nr:hypothetical protein L202_07473 [Cryptococcus amylolentus CBS 6039]ODN73979.1 hypothetical protein L202_07473 [Cryptococcus amylolentus CBS 6039]
MRTSSLVPALLLGSSLVYAHPHDSRSRSRHMRRAKREEVASSGRWSVYETSTWIADNAAATPTTQGSETVWVTEYVYDDDITGATGSTSASSVSQTASSSALEAVALAVSDSSSLAVSGSSLAVSNSSLAASATQTNSSAAASATQSNSSAASASITDAPTGTVSGDIVELAAVSATTSLATAQLQNELLALGYTISFDAELSLGFTVEGPTATSGSTTASATTTTSSTATGSNGTIVGGEKKVFAHFMVGIVSTYTQSDWLADMQLAMDAGIDGFALNIGVDSYSESQLDLAYAACETLSDFNVFISFDFNWYTTANVTGVADMLKLFKDSSAQYRVDGKPFVSSFIGDGFDWSSVASQVGEELYAVPYFQATEDNVNNAGVSGLFSWAAWPGQLDNVPVNEDMSTSRDIAYLDLLEASNKTYMMPVSSWFSTHFGTEVSYSKNWVFKGETLWKDRWDQVLEIGNRVNFVEIVTWNDYGESHHIGPYDTPHTDDSSSLWASGLDHTAMIDFAIPYIKAFKAGKSEPVIEQEMLVYWHRPHLKSASCDDTDNCLGKPTGWDYLEDTVFVSTMTQWGGIIKVTSGNSSPVIRYVEQGVQMVEVPMATGAQSFEFVTFKGGFGRTTSNVTVTDECWNGIYNYNYNAGSIKL